MLVPDLSPTDGDPYRLFLRGEDLGEARIRHIFRDRTGSPDSYAIVCPHCGVTWALMRSLPFAGFTPVAHLCDSCGDGMFHNILLHYNDFSLPLPAMIRDFRLEEKWGDLLPTGTSYA